MISLLREITYVRLLVPFCLGIVSFIFLPQHPAKEFVLIVFASCAAVFLAWHFVARRRSSKYQLISGMFAHLLFYLAGYLLCAQHTQINDPQHFSKHLNKDSKVLVQVDEPLAETDKTYKTVCKVVAVMDSGGIHNVSGKALVYFRKNEAAKNLAYGDRLWVEQKFSELSAPKNPGEFSYKRYMGFRQVYHQAFLNNGDWSLHGSGGGNFLVSAILQLRNKLLGILREHVKDDQAFAVSSSLILGIREKMDDDLMKAYSTSGTLHVLSVSGLHVAMMFQIFSFAFFFLNRSSRSRIVKSIIIILLIWLYASLTGLSAPVIRAAVMFTFFALGANLKRVTNTYNLLACSAFALLLYNPYYLMEVGFQLSYVAVAGIVMLYPKIYPVVYARVKALDFFWQIIGVSIAAQIATTPLTLLYFHQFPVYFLIGNLVVIPVSNVILYIGVALLGLNFIPGLGDVLGFCLEKSLSFMNGAVVSVDALPYALVQGISFGLPEALLVYFTILAIAAFIYWRRNEFMIAALLSTVLLLGWNVAQRVQHENQRKLVVYSVNKHRAVDFISGTQHLFLADSSLLNNDKILAYHVKPNWWLNGLRSTTGDVRGDFGYSFVKKEKGYVSFLDKRILLLDNTTSQPRSSEKLKVDYVILSQNVKVKMDDLVKMYNFSRIIFDSSNSSRRVKGWKLDCVKLGLNCYDVNESGAYVENL